MEGVIFTLYIYNILTFYITCVGVIFEQKFFPNDVSLKVSDKNELFPLTFKAAINSPSSLSITQFELSK